MSCLLVGAVFEITSKPCRVKVFNLMEIMQLSYYCCNVPTGIGFET